MIRRVRHGAGLCPWLHVAQERLLHLPPDLQREAEPAHESGAARLLILEP